MAIAAEDRIVVLSDSTSTEEFSADENDALLDQRSLISLHVNSPERRKELLQLLDRRRTACTPMPPHKRTAPPFLLAIQLQEQSRDTGSRRPASAA